MSAALSILFVGVLGAQAEGLQLEQVLTSTETHLPLLKAALLENELADAELLVAEGAFDVSLKVKAAATPGSYYEQLRTDVWLEKPTALWGATGFAGWRSGWGSYPSYEGKLETLDSGEFRAGLSVPLWRNGPTDRRRATEARAVLSQQIAGQTIEQLRLDFRRAAAHRYWAWVSAGLKVQVARSLLETAQQRDAGLLQRVQKGDLPEYERLDNVRAIEQRRAQVASAERALEQASIELSLYWRNAEGRPTRPLEHALPAWNPEAIAAPQLESTVATARERRPDLQRLQRQLEQFSIELRYAENQLAPAIDVSAAASQDIGPPRAARPDLSKPAFELGLSIELPVQTRAATGRVELARVGARRLREQLTWATERAEAEVRDAHSAIVAAQRRFSSTRAEQQASQSLEEGERLRFEQGESHLLMVNLREQQTMEARLRVIDAWFDGQRGLADLAWASAELPR